MSTWRRLPPEEAGSRQRMDSLTWKNLAGVDSPDMPMRRLYEVCMALLACLAVVFAFSIPSVTAGVPAQDFKGSKARLSGRSGMHLAWKNVSIHRQRTMSTQSLSWYKEYQATGQLSELHRLGLKVSQISTCFVFSTFFEFFQISVLTSEQAKKHPKQTASKPDQASKQAAKLASTHLRVCAKFWGLRGVFGYSLDQASAQKLPL